MDLAFGIGCHVYGHASPQDVTGVLWSCNMAKMVSERCRPHFSTASKGQSCKMSIVIDWTEQFGNQCRPPINPQQFCCLRLSFRLVVADVLRQAGQVLDRRNHQLETDRGLEKKIPPAGQGWQQQWGTDQEQEQDHHNHNHNHSRRQLHLHLHHWPPPPPMTTRPTTATIKQLQNANCCSLLFCFLYHVVISFIHVSHQCNY